MDLSPTVENLLSILLAALILWTVTKIVPDVKALWKPFKDNYPVEAAFLEQQAAYAVDAAEQYVEGPGGDKMEYALEHVQRQAEKYGYTFDAVAVRTLIEANVRRLKERTLEAFISGEPQP